LQNTPTKISLTKHPKHTQSSTKFTISKKSPYFPGGSHLLVIPMGFLGLQRWAANGSAYVASTDSELVCPWSFSLNVGSDTGECDLEKG